MTHRFTIHRSMGLATALAVWIFAGPGAQVRAGEAKDSAPRVVFNRDIRPILAEKCFKCHGLDAHERKGKLRLDLAEFAVAPAASGGRAIVPRKLDESELYERITSADESERMPPPKSGKTLSAGEVETLKRWILQGAEYQPHWSFAPPVRPETPLVKNRAWPRGPIDAFVLERLEAQGLEPSPEAERTTLIRRLALDLIGLPPTIAEVDAFLADARPDAYERLVDRLLDSPRLGERWGRLWLDAARYADSDGYEKDKQRQVSFYRDWVIRAINRDLPYDQFVIEQIAGDLLPDATQDQKVATGFLRNSMNNEEGGIDPEQFRMEAMFDRMDCVGKGILGLTIQCAQCHDHKFDPLKQEDYYRMFACLNNSHEGNIAVYTPLEEARRAQILGRIGEIEADLKHRAPDWAKRMAAWEEGMKAATTDWVVVRPEYDEESSGGEKYRAMGDGSLLAGGYAPTKHTLVLRVKTNIESIAAARLELLTDPNLPRCGPGRSIKGTGALTEIRIEAQPVGGGGKPAAVKIAKATADVNPPTTPLDPIHDDHGKRKRVTGPVAMAIDGDDDTAWGVDIGPGLRNQPRKAVFTFDKPVTFKGGALLTIHLAQNHGGWNSDDNQNLNLGRFRLSVTAQAGAVADPLPAAARAALAIPSARRTKAQAQALFASFRSTVPEWRSANEQIDALWYQYPEGTTQLVLAERDAPRPTSVLNRGDFLKPTRRVERGVPGFLNPAPSAAMDRLALGRWLVDRRAPTTARSIVNRVWQAYFGVGLVATSEDLGVQCEPPSHPELLDWLAVEFMDGGWRLKRLHRLITTSAVYRQTARATDKLLERDPYNRLLARGARFRLDAELVRDVALAASGLMDGRLGGPSVYPAAPAFLFQPPTSYGPKVWNEATGPDRYRRALYTFRYRSVPYPALQAFDAPNGDFACVRRQRSNTPLQALVTLNEPIFLECAQALGLRTLREGGSSDVERLTFAFRACLSRAPAHDEARTLLDLLEREKGRFARGEARPEAILGATAKSPAAAANPALAAAWTVVARVLLNLDETITRE